MLSIKRSTFAFLYAIYQFSGPSECGWSGTPDNTGRAYARLCPRDARQCSTRLKRGSCSSGRIMAPFLNFCWLQTATESIQWVCRWNLIGGYSHKNIKIVFVLGERIFGAYVASDWSNIRPVLRMDFVRR